MVVAKVLSFQQWFSIENRTVIKEFMSNMVDFDSLGIPKTMGGALVRR